ncbi:hypothetical protein [Faecalicoccus acidiformans]|uniref:Uncharacterized protein n=1 Tax=Faecalicoccus acidiformans TaxID=915173 RepID=A0ABS2FN17_9FIRM|nr:hypothetical protein [Faecalicoccus acidiformans]MBM6831012.1 hypothetical protein [Faecalicoccus acidiformans]
MFDNTMGILQIWHQLRDHKKDYIFAHKLTCFAIISDTFAENNLKKPSDYELIVLTDIAVTTFSYSDDLDIESIIRYISNEYCQKRTSINKLKYCDSYEMIEQVYESLSC